MRSTAPEVTAAEHAAPLRVALVGASTIAADFVLPALRAVDGVEPGGVLSSVPARGAAFAERFGLDGAYASLAELLEDPAVDAVYVSTNHLLHAEQAHAAIAAGKHVLCEKPIALSGEEAAELVAAAYAAGVVLATDHHFRNAPWIRRARELVREGALGRMLAGRVAQVIEQPPALRERRLDPADPGAGVIWDMTVHSADTVAYVLGEPIERVAAFATNRQGDPHAPEDTVMGVFETAGGVPVSFVDSFESAHAGSALELHGEDGSLVVADGALDELATPTVTLRWRGTVRPVECGPRVDLYEEGVARFAAAVHGDGRPAADGVDGARSVAVAEAVRAAVRDGRVAEVRWIDAYDEAEARA